MIIRIATPDDACEALAIYAQSIDTPVTFEYELPTPEEFARRIRSTLEHYPYLVCCDEAGTVRGYAYAGRFGERAAYQWGAELSIYLDVAAIARGYGSRLYAALIALLRLQGIRVVYGCVTMPNPRSERLHEKLGFCRCGLFRNAGFKCGAWRDVAWFEKEIAAWDGEGTPPEPVPFSGISPETAAKTIARVEHG